MLRFSANTIAIFLTTIVCIIQSSAQPSSQAKVGTATGTVTVNIPSGYGGSPQVNFVRTWVPQQPYTLASDVSDSSRTVSQVNRSTQYIDGLGRALQTVNWQNSPGMKDIVLPLVYDTFGREQYRYLPYASGDTNGSFKTNPFSAQNTFYGSTYLAEQPALTGEQYFYGHTQFESSPLNRVQKTFAPGNNWAGSEGGSSEHNTQTQYLVNETSDDVRVWTITNNALTYSNNDQTTNIPSSSNAYAAGLLYKTISTDERGKQVIEYKDKDGLVILKKLQVDDSPSASYTGWQSTYYVYDDYRLLRFVIPPKAVTLLAANSWVLSTDIINELCFRYEYDGRNRMIAKKVPGSGWAYIVYDWADRVVFMRDGNMGTVNQWTTILYDALGRPTQTAMMTGYSGNREDLQSYVTSNLTTSIPSSVVIPLTYMYYDNYTNTSKSYDASNNSKLDQGGNAYADTLSASASTMVKGKTTGTKVRVIENLSDLTQGAWLELAIFYDDKGRTVQTQSTNYKGGQDILTNRYDFTNKVVCTYTVHNNPAAGISNLKIKTNNDYDQAGRLLKVAKVINDDTSSRRIIVRNEYDAMGQLLYKSVGQKTVSGSALLSTPLELQAYAYNIRGWLKGINWKYDGINPTSSDIDNTNNKWFGMDLSYDWGFTANQYNGNIAGIMWAAGGDGATRAYEFGYDNANRLLAADFSQNFGSASSPNWTTTDPIVGNNFQIDFSVKMGDGSNYSTAYDENGNIKKMRQWGLVLNASPVIDNLNYTYSFASSNNTNKLLAVTDSVSSNNHLGDFIDNNLGLNDYTYDDNGNLKTDLNKNIDSIVYNHLNLPYLITLSGKGTIKYIYDALGNKLEKRVVENGTPTTKTTYLDGYVYQNDTLQYFGHEEGRIRPIIAANYNNQSNYAYDYFLKDHLGNTRTMLTDELKQDIYPAATLEGTITDPSSATYIENQFFTIDPSHIVGNLSGSGTYPNNNGIPNNNPNVQTILADTTTNFYQINGSTTDKTGLGITLHVMAGDKIDIFGKSYYYANNSGDNTSYNLPFTTILSGLLGTPGNVTSAGHPGVLATDLETINNAAADLGDFLTNNNSTRLTVSSTIPRAYINYIIFDEHFKFVSGNASPVGSAGVVKDHHDADPNMQGITIPKNGYLYVYCSNESPVNVYFDNLQIVHSRGPLLQEAAYYPFGLAIQGISSRAAGSVSNKIKFNGNEEQREEFSDGSGLDLVDFNFRTFDAQIGRFSQIDPLAVTAPNWSPYAFAQNNPILFNDPSGLDTIYTNTPDKTPGFGPDPAKGAILPEVKLSDARKPATARNGFYLPVIRKHQAEYSDEMYARIRDGRPLIQKGDPAWLKDQIPYQLRNYQAEQEGRNMQIGAVIALATPLLISISPELLAIAQDGITLINEGATSLNEIYTENSVIANARTRIFLAKYLKNAPDLAKLGKTAQKLYQNKIVKEVIKQVAKEVQKLF